MVSRIGACSVSSAGASTGSTVNAVRSARYPASIRPATASSPAAKAACEVQPSSAVSPVSPRRRRAGAGPWRGPAGRRGGRSASPSRAPAGHRRRAGRGSARPGRPARRRAAWTTRRCRWRAWPCRPRPRADDVRRRCTRPGRARRRRCPGRGSRRAPARRCALDRAVHEELHPADPPPAPREPLEPYELRQPLRSGARHAPGGQAQPRRQLAVLLDGAEQAQYVVAAHAGSRARQMAGPDPAGGGELPGVRAASGARPHQSPGPDQGGRREGQRRTGVHEWAPVRPVAAMAESRPSRAVRRSARGRAGARARGRGVVGSRSPGAYGAGGHRPVAPHHPARGYAP